MELNTFEMWSGNKCNKGLKSIYLQLTPGDFHPSLSVQALVDGLERPSAQFDVKLEKPPSWRRGDGLHLRLLLSLLAGRLNGRFGSVAARVIRRIPTFALLFVGAAALRGAVFWPGLTLGAGTFLYATTFPPGPIHYSSQVYVENIPRVVALGRFAAGLLVRVGEPQTPPDESVMHVPPVARGRVRAGVTPAPHNGVQLIDVSVTHSFTHFLHRFTLRIGN